MNDTTRKGGEDCEECGGTGTREDDSGAPCECIFCDGTGREPEPKPPPCACYDVRKDGVIYPVLCSVHARDRDRVIGYMTYRYQRYFDTEQDAKDRRRILFDMYPPEGYGTSAAVYPVGRWWLVLASWGSAD